MFNNLPCFEITSVLVKQDFCVWWFCQMNEEKELSSDENSVLEIVCMRLWTDLHKNFKCAKGF